MDDAIFKVPCLKDKCPGEIVFEAHQTRHKNCYEIEYTGTRGGVCPVCGTKARLNVCSYHRPPGFTFEVRLHESQVQT